MFCEKQCQENERRQASAWEKVSAKDTFDKGLLSKIHIELLNLNNKDGASLLVQWLGLCTSTAGGVGLISGWGTKISHAAQCSKKTNKQKLNNKETNNQGKKQAKDLSRHLTKDIQIADKKPIKRCCTLYDISKMQIKTTKASHHTSILLVKMWITDNTKYWQGCEAKGTHSLLVGMKKDRVTLEDNLAVSWKFTSTQKPARGFLQQLYSQLPKLGSNQDILQ